MASATAVSEAFQPQAAYNAKLMGLESAQVTWVQHPISDQAVDENRPASRRPKR